MKKPLRVLLVEDSEDDALLLVRELKRSGYTAEVRRVETMETLQAELQGRPWDVVLCDYSLPELDAPRALRAVRESGLDLPFIIVSGTIGEERAVESMRAGAQDFVLKDRLARLVPAVEREVQEAARRAEQAKMREQLKQSEIALARSEKLRALGQMAAGITHDLKNLLAPLALHLQVLERAARRANDDSQGSLGEMRQILDRGIRTIDRLREFSRQSPERRLERVDLNRIAREAAEVARPRMTSSKSCALCVIKHEPGEPPEILGQTDELLSAVVNLVINAIDAMPGGGDITVRTGGERGGAWIEVEDDGPGMAPDVEARVFEPFFSTKGVDGTGLGLAMVYACVVRHGGTVTLTTAPGAGARFRLWFPAPPPPQSSEG